MKILYIHQYFRTPEEGGCTRSYHLARGLVKNGHEVVVISGHNSKATTEVIEGVIVHYLKIPYRNEFGFLKRIAAFYQFVKQAIRTSNTIQCIDLAYVMTTPLSTGLIALHLKKERNIPFIFEVGDLWPEAPIQMGVVKNKWIKTALRRFEKRCYQESTKVIALSPAIKDYINALVPKVKVEVITNIAHCSFFEFHPVQNTSDKVFQIGYIGSLGKANDLSILLGITKESQARGLRIQFNIMGEGAEEPMIRSFAMGMPNVNFIDFGSKNSVKGLIEKMDAVYVSFKNIPILNTGSPNKFFDGLAAGKLIIINFGGWIKKLVEENKCGFYHSSDDLDSFFDKLVPYLNDKNLLAQAQEKSRKLAESKFDKKILVKKFSAILSNNLIALTDNK